MNIATLLALSSAIGISDPEEVETGGENLLIEAFDDYGHEQDKLACRALGLAASTLRNAVVGTPEIGGAHPLYAVGHRLALVFDDVRALDIDGRRVLAEILAGIGIVVVGDFIAQGGLR